MNPKALRVEVSQQESNDDAKGGHYTQQPREFRGGYANVGAAEATAQSIPTHQTRVPTHVFWLG